MIAFLSLFFPKFKDKLHFVSSILMPIMQKIFIIFMIHIVFSNQLSKHLYLHTLIKLFIGALITDANVDYHEFENRLSVREQLNLSRNSVIVIKWLIEFERGFCFVFSDKGTLTRDLLPNRKALNDSGAVIKWTTGTRILFLL